MSCNWWSPAGSARGTTHTGLLPRLENIAVRHVAWLLGSLCRHLNGIVSAMALFSREFIAVPDDRKGQIVFKWPDVTIRRFTHAIVNADEVAMFVNTGQIAATMDFATGGNAYRAELYFVGTREYTGFKFGGRVDDVQDPRTGLVVTLRVF